MVIINTPTPFDESILKNAQRDLMRKNINQSVSICADIVREEAKKHGALLNDIHTLINTIGIEGSTEDGVHLTKECIRI